LYFQKGERGYTSMWDGGGRLEIVRGRWGKPQGWHVIPVPISLGGGKKKKGV